MPPRARSPRPRPNPSRRPRVAGLAPTAPRPDGSPSGPADPPAAAPPDAPAEAGTRAPAGPDADRPGRREPRPAAEGSGAADQEDSPSDAGAEAPARREPGRKPPRPRPAAREEAEARAPDAGDDTADAAPAGGLAAAVRRRAVPLLAAALVVLTGVAVFAGVQDARLRGTPAATNTALVDVGATAEVANQLSDAIETVYSFDFARLDENENAARAVITPAFAAEFDRLFAEVRARAPEQQAVVSATVTQSAVKEITGDRAVLVAFVDQQATRAAADAESQQLAAAGRLAITGERVDGRWKIAAVTPL